MKSGLGVWWMARRRRVGGTKGERERGREDEAKEHRKQLCFLFSKSRPLLVFHE
jgi:hypothetical protein